MTQHPSRSAGSRVADRISGIARALTRGWRHSLQVRVGSTTLLVTGLVVLITGVFLVDQVTGGILRAKKQAAIGQARVGLDSAGQVLAGVDASVSADVEDARQQITQILTASGTSAGLFSIAIESSGTSTDSGPVIPGLSRRATWPSSTDPSSPRPAARITSGG